MKILVQYFVNTLCVAAAVCALSLSSSTLAQDDDAMSADQKAKDDAIAAAGDDTPSAPVTVDEETSVSSGKVAIPEGHYGALMSINGGFGSTTATGVPNQGIFAWRSFENMLLGVGLGFSYDGDGLSNLPPEDTTTGELSTMAIGIGVHFEYWLYNQNRFAIGPEITWTEPLIPSQVSFKQHVVSPGLVFWYVPWDVPIAIGAAWDVEIFQSSIPNAAGIKNEKLKINFFTPSLRLAFGLF